MTGSIKRRSETDLTYELKWAAWRWLYEEAACRVIGFEVRLEGPSGRVADVVGIDRRNRVYLVEVKASRSDLQKDNHTRRDRERLLARSESLARSAEFSAELNGVGGASTALVLEEEERAAKRHAAAENRLAIFSTKFHDEAYLRAADFHYLMTPHGLVWPRDLPPFWGLINERAETLVEAPPKQVRRVTSHVLRAIGKANARDLMKACRVEMKRRDEASAS